MNAVFSLFSAPTGTFGSMTRMLALAKKFTHKGHCVTIIASGKTASRFDELGYTVYRLPQSTILGLPKKISDAIVYRSQRVNFPVREGKSIGNLWLVLNLTGYGNRRFLLKYVQQQMQICSQLNPDIIITELDPGAYICGYLCNIPTVSTYSKIAKKDIDSFIGRRIKRCADFVIKSFDKEKSFSFDIIFGENILKIIPSIPELEMSPDSFDVCYCGNMLEDIMSSGQESIFKKQEGKKYIFCYFGTGSISLNTVQKHLVGALKAKKDIVCYVAAQSIKEAYSIGNVHFVKYIDANAIMPYAMATICHGGLNTITQSLEFGVPVIVFPGPIFERRFNAQRVQDLRVGYFGELSDFNDQWLRNKIDGIDKIKDNVLDIQRKFKTYSGTHTAYDYILKWLVKTE